MNRLANRRSKTGSTSGGAFIPAISVPARRQRAASQALAHRALRAVSRPRALRTAGWRRSWRCGRRRGRQAAFGRPPDAQVGSWRPLQDRLGAKAAPKSRTAKVPPPACCLRSKLRRRGGRRHLGDLLAGVARRGRVALRPRAPIEVRDVVRVRISASSSHSQGIFRANRRRPARRFARMVTDSPTKEI